MCEGTGRVDLWPNFWTDSWDESKLPRRRRVARVGRDLMEMGSTWTTAKGSKGGSILASGESEMCDSEMGLMGKISATQGGPIRGL